MYNELIGVAGQLGIVAAMGLAGALLFRSECSVKWLLVALGLYLLNDILLTRGLGIFPQILPDAQWNWQGKLLALIATLAVASLPQFGWKRVGLTWHQGDRPWPAYALTILLALFFLALAIADGDDRGDLETIAFQWTMPGLEEEPFYRGTLLLAMNEAFRRKVNILGAAIGYGGVLTAFLFGFGHALSFGTGGFEFETMTFLVTAIPSLLLLWIRERTGSLVLPIIGHNIANGAGTLI